MYLSPDNFDNLDAQALRSLIGLSIPEDAFLDYKESMDVPLKKESKREFLKDISAFANAMGGHLLIGCKEPAEGLSMTDQLLGIAGADSLSQDLERLASTSLDPPIVGLRFKVVPVSEQRSCIVVHVPSSMSSPHMVNHSGHRTFYRRGSESTFPMTTNEVRELMLATVTAEQTAKAAIATTLEDAIDLLGGAIPFILVQAVPLVRLTPNWDVLNSQFAEVIRGSARRNVYKHCADLASSNAPLPTLHGVAGSDAREDPVWQTEIRRNGHVSALLIKMQMENINGAVRPTLHSGYCDFFRAFAAMLQECLDVSGVDPPYAITAVHRNSSQTALWVEQRSYHHVPRYGRNHLQWPLHIRQPGTDPQVVAEELSREMFNAFGLPEIVD